MQGTLQSKRSKDINKVRIGLAGFGYWGPNLARAISNQKNAKLVAIADANLSSLNKASEQFFGIETYEDYLLMLKNETIDAIVVAMPAKMHEVAALDSIKSGKHVLVEKPMVLNPKVGENLAEIAKIKNLIIMPGHTFVYNDLIVWAKAYISDGCLGKILNIYSQRLNLGQLRNDVNVVWNLAPHDISIFDYLLNSRPISVSATGASITQEGIEDVAFLSVKYHRNIIAHLHVSWLDPTKTRKITIIGTKGMMIIDDANSEFRIQIHEKFVEKIDEAAPSFGEHLFSLHSGDVKIPKVKFREPLILEIEDFVTAIIEKRSPRATIEDGIWVARTLSAAEKSISAGGASITV